MIVQVQLFAVAKELGGRSVVAVELREGATLAELRQALADELPQLAALLPRMRIAVGGDYADDRVVIPPNADVACIPPVSGG